jgi:uncharacterized protein with HEPN domain
MSADRDWRLLFEDIIEAAEKIEQYTRGMDFESFASNSLVTDAVVRNLEIVGEAARHVPPDVKARCPEVSWRQMNDMRNILIHAYSEVDLTIVWNAMNIDLPQSVMRLRQLLDDEGGAEA